MDLNLGSISSTDLDLGYTGAYQAASAVDIAAAASAASTATGEVSSTFSSGGASTGALSVTGLASGPAQDGLELGYVDGTTLNLGGMARLSPPGIVSAAATAQAVLSTFVWPYALTAHGEPHPNSVMFGNTFGTSGPVQIGLPTGGNASVVEVAFTAMDLAQGWIDDVADYSTPIAQGSATYTFPYKIHETGVTGSFERTFAVVLAVDAGAVVTSTLQPTAAVVVDRLVASAVTAELTASADNIATKDAQGGEAAELTISAVPAVARKAGGQAQGMLTSANNGIDVLSDGASFVQSSLFATGEGQSDRVGEGAATAQLSQTGNAATSVSVNVASDASAALSQTGEFVRSYSVGSSTTSVLFAQGSSTDTVVAQGAASAAGVGAANPEVTRDGTGAGAAALNTTGVISKGVSATGAGAGLLTPAGVGFIDRGFEVEGSANSSGVGSGTPVYDAVTAGTATGGVAATAEPATTKSVPSASVASLFAQAVPAVDIEVRGAGLAQGAGAGSAVAGLVIRAGGAAASAGAGTGTLAKTISYAGFGSAILVTIGQGATNQEGAGSTSIQLRTAAETLGGTAVAPGTLTVDQVAIFPALSCYTKVSPALYGDGLIRPR